MGRQSTPSFSIQSISPIEFKAASTNSPSHNRHFEPPIKMTVSHPTVAQLVQKSMMNSGSAPNWRRKRTR
jgi:hypothetical protein